MIIYLNSENKVVIDFEGNKVEYDKVAIKISEALQGTVIVENVVFVPKQRDIQDNYKMAE